MRVALIGYGKMGRAIYEILKQRQHEVVLIIDQDNLADRTTEKLKAADVAIEFTGPEAAPENIRACLDAGVAVVSGSTGWLAHLPEMEARCNAVHGAMICATNFSLGVNIFFEINRRLASLMSGFPDYKVQIEETHHTAKKDAPSGTAITLAEQVLGEIQRLKAWENQSTDQKDLLPILSFRQDPAPGTHRVVYHSAIDDIEIIHTAHNRTGFALGAVLAAEFIIGKKGIFSMRDVLGIG